MHRPSGRRRPVSEAVLRFPDPDQVRVVFGHRDRHLRKVRDELGLSAVLRGEELRLRGDRDQVKHGKAVFEELARLARRGGRVEAADVSRALAGEFSRPFDPIADGDGLRALPAVRRRRTATAGPLRTGRRSRCTKKAVRSNPARPARRPTSKRFVKRIWSSAPARPGAARPTSPWRWPSTPCGPTACGRSSSPGRPSRPAKSSGSCPATCSPRSTRTSARCWTR